MTLHEVKVRDSPELEGLKCKPPTPGYLGPGRIHRCTGVHKITQADLDNGSFTDEASATSKQASTPNAADTITAEQKPKLGLTKKDSLNPAKYDKSARK